MKSNDLNILKKEIEHDPANFYLIRELGDLYFFQGQYNEAVKQYSIACNYNQKLSTDIILKFEKQILKTSLNNTDALISLIYFYLEQGAEEEALFELYNLIEDNLRDLKAFELLLKILKKSGKEDEAINILNKAINEGLYENFIVDSLKEIYLAKGMIVDSIKLMEKVTSNDAKNINFLKDLAELYYMNNEFQRSVGVYKNIVQIYPSAILDGIHHIQKIINLKGDDVSYHQTLGDWYLRLLKPNEAVEEYKIVFEKGKGSIELAIDNFRRVLEYYPDFIPARFSLAEVYLKQRSFSEAVMEYNIIFKKQPDLAPKIILGLENILIDYPKQILAFQSLSSIYWKINDKQKAVQYMTKWLDLSIEGIDEVIDRCNEYINNEEDNVEAMELLAKAYSLSGKISEAKEITEKILYFDEKNLKALTILAEIHKNEGQLNKAKDLLLKTRKINPIEYRSFLSLKEVKLRILSNKIDELKNEINLNKMPLKHFVELGINYYYTGRLIDAISSLQKGANEKDLASTAHYYLGNCFKEYGRFDLSLDQYMSALRFDNKTHNDDTKEILYKMGMSNEALGRLKEAQEDYERIYKLDINYEGIKERLAKIDKSFTLGLRGKILAGVFNGIKDNRFITIYVKNKEEETIIKSKKKQRNLSFGQDHNDRGVDKLLSGMVQAAEEEFLLAEQLDPELTSIKNNLGLIYLMHGDLNKARIKFEEAININKDLTVVYNNLALTYHIAKDYNQAQKLYDFALEQDNQLSIINLNLGDLKYHQGNLADSLKLWKKAESETVLPELARRRMLVGELTFF